MFDFNSSEGFFIHLIKSALNNEQPEEKPNNAEWEKIFELSRRHNVSNLVWFSIEKLNEKPEGELFTVWQEVYAKAASKCFKQMMEIEFLSEEFSKRGYDIMFLKGSEIRNYYPSPDMRTMSDIDLLVKSESREPVREIMAELGYEEDVMDDGQVDAFKKLPILYTEIHYDFSNVNHAHHDLFSINWTKLIKTENPHIYVMTFEDLYFFNVGHYVKNMSKVGMGIRGVMDCYVLWNAASDEQKKRILSKFENTGIVKFNESLLKVGKIWFGNAENDSSLDNFQKYLIENTTYGEYRRTQTIKMIDSQNDDKSNSKLKFVLGRIFPSANSLYKRFGIKKKVFIILPFLWLARILLLIFSGSEKKNNIKMEYSTVNDITPEEVEYEKMIRKELGL